MKGAYLLNCNDTENNFDSECKVAFEKSQDKSWVLKQIATHVESVFALQWGHMARKAEEDKDFMLIGVYLDCF